jgi:hypothetical protein
MRDGGAGSAATSRTRNVFKQLHRVFNAADGRDPAIAQSAVNAGDDANPEQRVMAAFTSGQVLMNSA